MGKEARLVIRWLDVVVCTVKKIDFLEQFISIIKEKNSLIEPFTSPSIHKQSPPDLSAYIFLEN